MSTDENTITVPEAADLLGLTRQRVDRLIRDGRLRVVRTVSRIRLLDRNEVEAFTPRGYDWRKKSPDSQ